MLYEVGLAYINAAGYHEEPLNNLSFNTFTVTTIKSYYHEKQGINAGVHLVHLVCTTSIQFIWVGGKALSSHQGPRHWSFWKAHIVTWSPRVPGYYTHTSLPLSIGAGSQG